MYLQINTVKYYANQEITKPYENLQIVQSQFFTDKLMFVYIWSNSNIFGLSVFGFDAIELKQRAILLHLTICKL